MSQLGFPCRHDYRVQKIAGCAKRARTRCWWTACRACGLHAPVLQHDYPRGRPIVQGAFARELRRLPRRHRPPNMGANLPIIRRGHDDGRYLSVATRRVVQCGRAHWKGVELVQLRAQNYYAIKRPRRLARLLVTTRGTDALAGVALATIQKVTALKSLSCSFAS